MGAPETVEVQQYAIRTLDDALRWGDAWMVAYNEQWRVWQAALDRVNDELFIARINATILEAELRLLRYDIDQALHKP